ncbi:hypothetical protein LSAT2_026508 [Lamellibrachia satsuma]|nr:hypothetical protein LSAT2_026508 [Lamellibrachia satsuma]
MHRVHGEVAVPRQTTGLGYTDYDATKQRGQKRMRTIFKHHQLRTLKTYFALNQNPDAKDLTQLSQKTVLNRKVLQVCRPGVASKVSLLFVVGAIHSDAELAYSQDGYVQMARQKRMRTSFKHHQLRTMKSYFSLNHNPDAKDLKQLAQKTGLSKRILQVWFQNARAKYRRNQLKQQDRSACVDDGGQCPVQDAGSLTLDDSCSNSSSKLTAAEASSGAHSPAISDISSSPSLSVLRGNTSESESLPSGSALAGLFSSLHSGL